MSPKPTLILDKSILHGLSSAELKSLRAHFAEVVTKPLVVEILGDLSKEDGRVQASRLARKLIGANVLQESHIDLGRASLFGTLSFERGLPVSASQLFEDRYEDKTGYSRAIALWADGVFSAEELARAANWRAETRALTPHQLLAPLRKLGLAIPVVRSLDTISDTATALLNGSSFQGQLLHWIMETLNLNGSEIRAVYRLWGQRGKPPVYQFAWYAYYLQWCYVALVIAIKNNLISWSPTCLVDNQYLHLLPFCGLFATATKIRPRWRGP